MNIALLIIDVQDAYIGHRKNEPIYEKTFEYINYTSALFRKNGKPVIIVRDIESGDGPEYKNVDELVVENGDIQITKIHNNSFWQTNLKEILDKKKVDFVVLCGNAAEYCVIATYFGAKERGLGAAMLQNGIFAGSETGLLDIALNRPLVSCQFLASLFAK
ncbi:MAG: isochorismatase family protein [Eubacteriales bacterium]